LFFHIGGRGLTVLSGNPERKKAYNLNGKRGEKKEDKRSTEDKDGIQ